MKNIITIKDVADWFIAVKAPDLKEKIETGLKVIESGQSLEGNYKKLFGFMLFSYSMGNGPISFLSTEYIAEQISVTDEMKQYAQSWINHPKTTTP